MGDINCILLNNSKIIKQATLYKPAVKKYNHMGNNYFVKEYQLSNSFQKNKVLKILLTFELLKYMNINIPEISTYYDDNKRLLKVLSKECGIEQIAEQSSLPNSKNEQEELAKIIYTADLLGLGDVANDNIIKGDDKLFLIDFDPIDSSINSRFKPLNVFGNMGEEKYSVAKSFDLHNTKGNFEKLCEIPEFGANTDLTISENNKKNIEEKFFSLNRTKINEIVNNTINKYFNNISVDYTKIKEEIIERYEYILKSSKEAANKKDCEKNYSEVDMAKPLSKLLNTTCSCSFTANFMDDSSQDNNIYKNTEKEHCDLFQEYIKNKQKNKNIQFDIIIE